MRVVVVEEVVESEVLGDAVDLDRLTESKDLTCRASNAARFSSDDPPSQPTTDLSPRLSSVWNASDSMWQWRPSRRDMYFPAKRCNLKPACQWAFSWTLLDTFKFALPIVARLVVFVSSYQIRTLDQENLAASTNKTQRRYK